MVLFLFENLGYFYPGFTLNIFSVFDFCFFKYFLIFLATLHAYKVDFRNLNHFYLYSVVLFSSLAVCVAWIFHFVAIFFQFVTDR